MIGKAPNNFYCNQKFTWLSVDLEKRLVYSCCAAEPVKIDLSWLNNNPGQLFNMPELQQDRRDMLNNISVKSCDTACWKPESNNLPSRRLMMKSTERSHTSVLSQPTILNINLGSTCNLTCSYCCKQYSSAWARDIQDNGAYLDIDRFKLTAQDIIVMNISQKEQQTSSGFKLLATEIEKFTNLDQIHISGGEPFLYNEFVDLLNRITKSNVVTFYSGLGVNTTRLTNQLDKIQNIEKIKIRISAENINQGYEFNRYGNSYSTFRTNLELLIRRGFNIEFAATLSNLTIFGLSEFSREFVDYKIYYQFCNDPEFLNLTVMDAATKELVIDQILSSNILIKDKIINVIQQPCTAQHRRDLSVYLQEFAKRRKLSLDIFPDSMLQWLDIEN